LFARPNEWQRENGIIRIRFEGKQKFQGDTNEE
jgi:hypothetical protein